MLEKQIDKVTPSVGLRIGGARVVATVGRVCIGLRVVRGIDWAEGGRNCSGLRSVCAIQVAADGRVCIGWAVFVALWPQGALL